MGLDVLEFVVAAEETFQIAIPDETVVELRTPGAFVDHVLERVGQRAEPLCLEQRAFYRLRLAAMRVFARGRKEITPRTRWDDMLPEHRRRHNWGLLKDATGAAAWPRLILSVRIREATATVGGTSRWLARHAPASLQEPREGWSRADVEAVVRRLMLECFGIVEFSWDQEFVKDLGVS